MNIDWLTRPASVPRALLESGVLVAGLAAAILSLSSFLTPDVQGQALLFISAAGALFSAFRLPLWPTHPYLRRIFRELLYAGLLSLLLGIILPGIMMGTGLSEALRATNLVSRLNLFLIASGPIYLVLRLARQVWSFWNSLRRRRLVWELTHAQLVMVALMAVFFVIVMTLFTVSYANQEFPEQGPWWTFLLVRLVKTVIPLLGVTSVFTVVALVIILPPAALISYWVARRITRRLNSLTQTASQLQRGDYAARATVSGEDEVAQLQSDFNAMASELEHTLTELHAERDKVNALLENQRQLAASVSHELRTPVATIQGYLEPLMRRWPQAPAELKRDLRVIEGETLRLAKLIGDLLDISQAELGRLEMQRQAVSVAEVIERLANTFAPLAWESSRVQVISEGIGLLPPVWADVQRLEQILANLLRNAIRHTGPGGIVAILAELDRSNAGDQDGSYVQIQVRDTGEGISAQALPHIWERFYRGEGSSPGGAGAGLGLALVKELTEAMGGKVSVESTPGEGSCFSVFLPAVSPDDLQP
jgi:signal transduction histidine kinase